MIYDVLETKLVAAAITDLTAGNIFREHLPAAIPIGVMIRSPLTGIAVDPHIPGWYKPRLQVIVRHKTPEAGQKMANDVIAALKVEKSQKYQSPELGEVRIATFIPEHLPIQFPRSDGNGFEWSINFKTAFAFKPSWVV